MNAEHFRAFLWLRWRLRINQIQRAGIANAVIMAILAVAAILLALVLFIACFLVGLLALPEAPAPVLMYVWDGLVVVFLFWWGIGMLTELQRAEALALDKFLHLPVSLTSAFVINYVSSLLSLNMIVFVPAMLGLTLGLVFGMGPLMLLQFPLLVGFLLVITALTYQFQGWLASLMANKRRRRTIIVFITMGMILLCQLPNLINIMAPWSRVPSSERFTRHIADQTELRRALGAREITLDEFTGRLKKLQADFEARTAELDRQLQEKVEHVATIANLALPIGWLPLGAKELAEGNILPAVLGTCGLALIGAVSLRRAYRTTLRLYTGQFTSGKKVPDAEVVPARIDTTPAYFLEKQLPGLSEPAAAIALGSLRSLLRAPEAKMILLSPLLLVLIFGSMFMSRAMDPPPAFQPLLPFAAMAMVLLGLVQLVGNQFGFDRNGFRVYILSPTPRSDILLGKNLAVAPVALSMGGVLFFLVAILYPLRLDHFLAVPFQFVSMYLLFCMVANWLSIMAPMAIAPGSMRASNPKALTILLNFLFLFLFPLALAPALLPLGIEMIFHARDMLTGVPICLLLTLVECAGVCFLYRLVLSWQGSVLQAREMRILELVAAKAE